MRISIRIIFCFVASCWFTACAGGMALSPMPSQLFKVALVKQGKFQVTFYQIIDEYHSRFASEPRTAALFGEANNLLALVSPTFKKLLAREGSGRLLDGRVVNYATRAGHEIRYKFVKDAPYGIGVDNYKLIPYRTIAVDPAQILIGSIVFIPQAYGLVLPNGEIHDGFFFAHDTGSKIKGRCLDLFVGFEHHVKNTLTRYGRIPNQSEVEVYTVSEPIAGALNQRYRRAYQRMPAQKLFEMNSAEIDSLLRTTLATYPDFVQRLSIYSEKAKGTPYKLSPLGEGPNGKYDRDPLVNFSRADCVTFCEQMLAMSISGSYAEMLQHLQRLRYRNGTVDFRARNHFMMADWLPNNAWLIEDVTKLVGGHLTARMTKTIDRAAFLRKMGVRDASVAAIPPQTMTIDYIPKENLSAIKSKLQGGEMVCIVQNQPGIFIAHTGFIIRDRFGNVLFRHASPRFDARQVIDEFFDDVVKQLGRDPNRAGMVLLRARPQFFN